MKARILIVDDDPDVVEIIRIYCHREEFFTRTAATGESAMHSIGAWKPDLVLLDLSLPDLDGLVVCQEMRKSIDIPIIILTARGEESERILGLELGADDYIAKPFSPRELIARIKAVLRRTIGMHSEHGRLMIGSLVIDTRQRTVLLDGEPIKLTPREYELLEFMAKSPGQAFHREQLLAAVWGYDFYGDARNVDTHIKNLRAKVGGAIQIESVWGIGYRLVSEVQPRTSRAV